MGWNYKSDGGKECLKIMTGKLMENGHLEVSEGDRLT